MPILSIVPKHGKDRQEIKNYCPVSALNLDNKLCTSIFARSLDSLTWSYQFRPDRLYSPKNTDNIGRILHILGQIQNFKIKSIVVSLGAEKVLDFIRLGFLYKLVGRFGFHDMFIRVIQPLYDKPTFHIKVNSDLSDPFILKNETR